MIETGLSLSAEQALEELEDTTASFYLNFLWGKDAGSYYAEANSRMQRSQYDSLPVASGAREGVILKASAPIKLAYLEAQVCDVVEEYAASLLSEIPDLPPDVQKAYERQVNGFVAGAKQSLSAELRRGLQGNLPAFMLSERLQQAFMKNSLLLDKSLDELNRQSQDALYLYLAKEAGLLVYQFRADIMDTTCSRCKGHDGKIYTTEDIARLGIIPPLHPNCRCELELVVYDENGAYMTWGEYWHEYFAPFRRIPGDIVETFNQYLDANAERFRSADSFFDYVDWLFGGIFSGIAAGYQARADKAVNEPSLYNILNNLTWGALEIVKGAFKPNEPFSLEHLADVSAMLVLMYGAHKLSQAALNVHSPSPAFELDYRNRIASDLTTTDNSTHNTLTLTNSPDTQASVEDKLNRYLLNKEHPSGGSKAEWFDKALGFNKANMDALAEQIVFDPDRAIQTVVTAHGIKYNQIITITGANGKIIDVTFAWIKNEDEIIRLVTAVPTKK